MSHQPGSIHRLVQVPGTYITEDCLVGPQWEKIHLIPLRLEAPGMVKVLLQGDGRASSQIWGKKEWDEELRKRQPGGGAMPGS